MSDERLWAPWRLDYIRRPSPEECIFCRAAQAGPAGDEEYYVVHRGERCFVMLNAFPYASGHVMVSPYEHAPSIEGLEPPALTELMVLGKRSLGALRDNYGPEGFNLGINHGKVAGAAFEDHVHLHVVPRWGGDNNFMPVVGGTRVLPQALEESWAELRERFSEDSG